MIIQKLLKNKKILHRLSLIQEPWYSIINSMANGVFLISNPEKKRKLGELNPNKTFYVICNLPKGGLAAQYDAVLGYLRRAEKKGYIPIVDFSKFLLWKSEERPEKNPWDYYFCQPSDYKIDEVYNSKNVIFNSELSTIYTRISKKNIHTRYRMSQKVWLNKSTKDFIENKIKEIGVDFSQNIIGAYYRGTDYKKTENYNPAGHAIVPDISQFCDILQADCERWKCNNIFFMTEEQEALDYFKIRFSKGKYVSKERISNYKPGIMVAMMDMKNTTRFENNRLYITDLYILSRCHYLVGTWNGGVRTAMNWNNDTYLDKHIIDLGTL